MASSDAIRRISPGPRVRMAARLYASGAVPTKRAACQAVGLSPTYLTVLDSHGNEVTTRIQDEIEKALEDQTVGLSKVIALLSRKATKRMGELIQSQNEHVAVKASSDILDRNPDTSKTFKGSLTIFSLDKTDAKELAEALVAGARVKEQFAPIATGDFVKVEDGNGSQASITSKSSSAEHPGSRQAPKAQGDAGRDTDQGQAAQGETPQLRLLKPEFTHGEEEV